jgi:hypothetical protein
MGKATGDPTPKRKRQPQRANKAVALPDPSSLRWPAEAENIRKRRASPFWQAAEQERMRLVGEKLGLSKMLR